MAASPMDESVSQYLKIQENRPFYLYLAGVAHLIYAEASTSQLRAQWLYSKVKLMRKQALKYLS